MIIALVIIVAIGIIFIIRALNVRYYEIIELNGRFYVMKRTVFEEHGGLGNDKSNYVWSLFEHIKDHCLVNTIEEAEELITINKLSYQKEYKGSLIKKIK